MNSESSLNNISGPPQAISLTSVDVFLYNEIPAQTGAGYIEIAEPSINRTED